MFGESINLEGGKFPDGWLRCTALIWRHDYSSKKLFGTCETRIELEIHVHTLIARRTDVSLLKDMEL